MTTIVERVSGNLTDRRSGVAWRALVAASVATVAIVLLAGVASPATHAAMRAVDGRPHAFCARPLGLALVVCLLASALGIWRGKRRAASLGIGLLLLALVLDAAVGAPAALTSLEAGVAMLLLAFRRMLPAAGGEPIRAHGIAVASAIAAACSMAAVIVLTTDRANDLASAVKGALAWLASGGSWLAPGSLAAALLDTVLVVALVAAVAFVRALLRPALPVDGHDRAEHLRAAALVARYGEDSLDPFTLREDKAFHFACGGMLAYRTLRETAVVSGDPIGPPGSAGRILASFERLAARRGWQVVLTGASPRHLEEYHELGLRSLCIGQEAVVDPSRFSLEGRPIRKVRQSVTRLERLGWQVEVIEAGALDSELMASIAALERRWHSSRTRLAGFAMTLGRLWGAEEDALGMYVIARDADGELRAFLRFAEYGRGLSLDATRRFGDEPNGAAEAMVVAALVYARERGIPEVSLNFAGFAHVMASRAAATRGQQLMRLVLRLFHGRFQLERLVRFSDKFGPEWRPRYMIHRGRTSLPLAGLRVLQAEAYVRSPRSRPLTARWEPSHAPVVAPAPYDPAQPAAIR